MIGDYLTMQPLPSIKEIVTNPPFKLAAEGITTPTLDRPRQGEAAHTVDALVTIDDLREGSAN